MNEGSSALVVELAKEFINALHQQYPKWREGYFRFSSEEFKYGSNGSCVVSDLRSRKVTADQVGNPLQVVMHEGLPFSIDNRRLVAFNLAGLNDVPIQVVTLENPAVAARFFDRFDPIGGVGQNIVITSSSGRTAAQMLLRDSGLIKGVQLGH